MTLPLGILKARTVAFTPELPASKQTVIDRLGFGILNKVGNRGDSGGKRSGICPVQQCCQAFALCMMQI